MDNFELLLVGSKVLVEVINEKDMKTPSGIILPASVDRHGEHIASGFVKQVGPGDYYIDHDTESSIPGVKKEKVKAVPLTVRPGDYVFYYKSRATEIILDKTYHVFEENEVKLIQRQKGF